MCGITGKGKNCILLNAYGQCVSVFTFINYINPHVKLRNTLLFVLQKHLILLIKGLCTGCSRLDRTEIITFTAMMKSAKLPQTVKTLSDGKCPFREGSKLS